MPTPRVFISSTCYDLKYIRENLKFFIRTLGYEPVLSEEGAVPYAPHLNIHDACLEEISTCQMFVLVIGGTYGSRFKRTDKSITNAEYLKAVGAKIPIFALVERRIHEQYRVYLSNKENPNVNAEMISYPAVDSTKIFDFIEEVQGQAVNNALVPFSDFEEMRNYLKQQWAGMMYRFLTSESEAKRVSDILSTLSSATEKIEFLTRQIVDSVADSTAKVTVEFNDFLLEHKVIRDLASWGLFPSPKKVLMYETFEDFCEENKAEIEAKDDLVEIKCMGHGISMSRKVYERMQNEYREVRKELIKRLDEKKISVDEFLREM